MSQVHRNISPPWWDKYIPLMFVVYLVVSSVVWVYLAPAHFAWLWPVAGIGGAFLGAGIIVMVLRSESERRGDPV